jgi:hypothetical protein
MLRNNWKALDGKGVPLSYALTGFIVVLPVLSYECFYYFHLYLVIIDM